MRKLAILMALCMVVALFVTTANAQAPLNRMEERGSLLVWPLVDNINYLTVIEVANATSLPSLPAAVPPIQNVTLECHVHTHGPGETGADLVKLDFNIELTPQEVFLWETYLPASAQGKTGLPNLANRKGFLFCFAIDPRFTVAPPRQEIDHDFLKGDAVLFALAGARAGQSFLYNAIPSQALAIAADRVLNLDGVEYTAAPTQIFFEGFATANPAFGPLEGELVVANLGVDFLRSSQPQFDINFLCYNEDEDPASLHVDYDFYEQYDMTTDLFLDFSNVQTRKFQCSAIASDVAGDPPATVYRGMWAITYQYGGTYAIGENVWQGINANAPIGAGTVVTLPLLPTGG